MSATALHQPNFRRLAGIGWMVTAASLWGSLGPVARSAFAAGLSPSDVAGWRALLATPFFVVHAALLPGRSLPQRADCWRVLAFAFVGVTLFYLSYQFAIAEAGAALASVLLYTAPAWVVTYAALSGQRRLDPVTLTALAATLVGITLIARPWNGGAVSVPGLAWGLVSALCYASYYLLGARLFERNAPAAVFAVVIPLGGLPLIAGLTMPGADLAAWAALLWIGVAATYGAYLCYAQGLRRLGTVPASLIATLEPVVAAAIAFAWWNESFALSGYAGAGLVLCAVVLTALNPTSA